MNSREETSNIKTLQVSKDKQQVLFDRGFKSWCENTAITLRQKLGQKIISPLSPYALAEKLGVIVWSLEKIPNLPDKTFHYLKSEEGNEWSAVTVFVDDKYIIITNPSHSKARQNSNLMHELAHILKKHDPGKMIVSESGYVLRDFDQKQEAEADWFASTILLPRNILEYFKYMRVPLDKILEEYSVSKDLYHYRMSMTAVNRQYRR